MYYLFVDNWIVERLYRIYIQREYIDDIHSFNDLINNKIVIEFDYSWEKIIEEKLLYKYWTKFKNYVCEIKPLSKLIPDKMNPGIYTTDNFIIKNYFLVEDLLLHKRLIENGFTENIDQLFYWCAINDSGDLSLTKYLLNFVFSGEINLDKCIYTDDSKKHNILVIACRNANNNFAQYLIQCGHFNFDIEKTIDFCLHHSNYKMAKYLLEYKKDCHFGDNFNIKIYLPYMCLFSNLEIVKYFANYSIFRGENIDDDILDECLKNAAVSRLDIVKYLVEIGANINNSDLYTEAIINGHIDIVKYLVECGVDYQIIADKIIQTLINYGHVKILEYFMDLDLKIENENNYLLDLAIKYGHLNLVKYLYKIGFVYDTNCVDSLISICGTYRLDCIKFIFENTDAELFDKDTIDKCYIEAAQKRRPSIMEYLFEKGYYPPIDYNLLYNLILKKHFKCVELLLKSDYDLTLNDYHAIKIAYKMGSNNIIGLFEKYISTYDINLTTTLISVINRSNYHVIPEIISKFYIDEIDPIYLSICNLYCDKRSQFMQDLEIPTVQNNLLILEAVICYGDIQLLKYLLHLNNNPEYNHWALIFSVKNLNMMKYLIENNSMEYVDVLERSTEIIIYSLLLNKKKCLKYLSFFGLIYEENLSKYLKANDSLKIIDYFHSKNAFIKNDGINITLEWND
uniref:Putative ankyrin repeat protein n=1 Tax=Moumouvirus sp. 'Monve' TaxID=1128131 RepID=H2EDC3_9VIRU|nr:putative ankyrin repeat protein [Moumouvirus Monve]